MSTLEIITLLKKYKVVPRLADGHLKLQGETAGLPDDIIQLVRSRKEDLKAFLNEAKEQWTFEPIQTVPLQAHYPASNAQKRIWVLSQLEGGSRAYNISRSFFLKGSVINEHLGRAFQWCIRRHESLRTVFREVDGELRQIVLDDPGFFIDFEDIRNIADVRSYLAEEVQQSISWRFDLTKGPLLKVRLFRLAEKEHAMIFGVHHIVSDGWSIGVMVAELMRAYEMYCRGSQLNAASLSIQYKDYTQWHAGRVDSDKGRQARVFWQGQFPDFPDPLNLPADFPRQAMKSFDGAVARFYPQNDLYQRMTAFCRDHQVTTFNFLRTTLSILLSRLSRQQDITIGTPVSGRNHPDLENQFGLYVNTLPLRARVEPGISFLDLQKKLSDHSFQVFEFQDYPFDRIIEDLNIRRDTSRNPLFDVMMVLQHKATGEGSVNQRHQHGFELGLLEEYLYPSGRQEDENIAVKFDLNFNFDFDPDDRFYLDIEYDTALFTRERIRRISTIFLYLIDQAMLDPEKAVGAMDLVDPIEKDNILRVFNAPVRSIEHPGIIHLLQRSFAERKMHTAIVFEDKHISYQELDRRSDQVAATLIRMLGTPEGLFIGVLTGRSDWTIPVILGILKTGAAYVPIDTAYPDTRIAYIIEDAQPSAIVVGDQGLLQVPAGYNGAVLHIKDIASSALTDLAFEWSAAKDLREHIAYVIYTSGSTGKPKGVGICHRNTIAFLLWAAKEFAGTSFDIAYAVTSYCFDLSIFEFFFPLMMGKTIRMLSSAGELPVYSCKDHGILINTVPSVVRILLDQAMDWGRVAALNMAGEPVPAGFRQLLDAGAMEIRNLYGPSETTTYSTVYRFAPGDKGNIPAGTPIDNTQIYILDDLRNLMPIGMDGEIYIGGQGVAPGYLHRPALTAERFVDNPFLPGQRMYRTGDIGRWTEDGKILYIGRSDDQVKIRGFRIEPGEIQYRLEQHEHVSQAIVTAQKIQEEYVLTGYVKGEPGLTPAMLKEYLGGILPSYMIPSRWVMLDEIPLNSNGKVDKKRLPMADGAGETALQKVAPETPLHHTLFRLWTEVLPAGEWGITDNFFDAGGHSLKAIRLRFLIEKELGKQISLNELFIYPTIQAQSFLLEGRSVDHISPILKADDQDLYPISLSQERLWILTGFREASVAYNMPAVFRVKGILDQDILDKAFRLVIERHEALRTVFTNKGGTPAQRVLSPEDTGFRVQTYFAEAPPAQAAALEWLAEEWRKPFDLSDGPLLSCYIVHTQQGQLLSFNMHHLVSDGWSLGVLYRDITAAYRQVHAGLEGPLPRPELQFRDYAVWHRRQLAEGRLEAHRAFWRDIFSVEPPAIELPLDYSRREFKTYRGASCRWTYPGNTLRELHRLARKADASLFITLMACVRTLLKKYTGHHDIIIGTPVSGRDNHQLQDLIGFFVNTLPVRVQVDPGASFLSLLKKEKEMILAAMEHQTFSFEMLLEELQLRRDPSRSPLFDVMVTLRVADEWDAATAAAVLPDLRFEHIPVATDVAKYDLVFSFSEQSGELLLDLEYNADLMMRSTIMRMMRHLARLFDQVTGSSATLIRDISLPDQEEYALLASRSDRSRVGYDPSATIVSLWNLAVERHRHRVALVADGRNMTYAELDLLSGQLANILIRDYKVSTGDLIVLHFGRTEWMIVCILAVLKAGAAYVPVDPDYPPARIAYILEDSASRLILFDHPVAETLRENYSDRTYVDITALDYTGDTAIADVSPNDLAYIIYTSGTTGNPKGVLIGHRQVARLLFHDDNLFDFGPDDRWTLFHSYTFDFSVWEMYGALLYGATLVIVPRHIAQDAYAFFDLLRQQGITVLNQTPTAFRSMMQVNQARIGSVPLQVKYLIFGGEALMPAILAPWKKAFPGCRIVNMYGITETTVHVTYKEITDHEIAVNRSNIGIPMPTVSCYVLDTDLRQAPVGVIGELCVGGAGVGFGYLHRPELTAEKFIDSPISPGGKMYRSGDFARILPDGDIEYIGRRDDQVKIRGHRIGIVEIEDAILKQKEIADAVVVPLKNKAGENELAAYIIPSPAFRDTGHLRNIIRQLLPAYMVPSYLIPLAEFPLNHNGKLDKKALPRPMESEGDQLTRVPCRNETDRQILAIWEAVLEKEGIGIQDSFFDLGGHSLKATRVIARIHETFGVRLDLKTLFIEPTVEYISNYIDTVRWMDGKDEVIPENQGEIIF